MLETPTDSRIIQFLRSDIADYKGRWLIDLQTLADYKLERSHDVIQWMFPTDIRSENQPSSPVLSVADVCNLKNNTRARLSIKRNLDRMVKFYETNTYWITQKNHNYKRLTRILRCLWLADLTHDYVALQKCLDDVFTENFEIVGEEVFLYWKNANNLDYLLEKREEPKRKKLPVDDREHNLEMFV